MSRTRRRGGPVLKTILWRDIPAQVNGTSGDHKVQVQLPPRFQRAIDRAAMVADKSDANSYIAEMTSRTEAADGDDIEAAVAAMVRQIEDEFTAERLNEFVAAGGLTPETTQSSARLPKRSSSASADRS